MKPKKKKSFWLMFLDFWCLTLTQHTAHNDLSSCIIRHSHSQLGVCASAITPALNTFSMTSVAEHFKSEPNYLPKVPTYTFLSLLLSCLSWSFKHYAIHCLSSSYGANSGRTRMLSFSIVTKATAILPAHGTNNLAHRKHLMHVE